MEIFIFTRFYALPGTEAAVDQALREVVVPTSKEGGCLGIHAFRSIRDPQLFTTSRAGKTKRHSIYTRVCRTR